VNSDRDQASEDDLAQGILYEAQVVAATESTVSEFLDNCHTACTWHQLGVEPTWFGPAVERIVGAGIEQAVGAAIERVLGPAIEQALGPAIERALGPAIERVVGPRFEQMTGDIKELKLTTGRTRRLNAIVRFCYIWSTGNIAWHG
jgi:hypothetical protein